MKRKLDMPQVNESQKPTDQLTLLQDLMNREEELHPELQAYLNETPGLGTVLQHPLVYAVPYIPTNAFYNAQFKHKQECLVRCRKEKNWGGYVFLHERPYRIDAFMDTMDELEPEEYWNLLADILIDTENQHQWIDKLYEVTHPVNADIRQARFHIMEKEELWELALLPEYITIYRGCSDRSEEGWSWTTEESIAEQFAYRWGKKEGRKIVKGQVAKAHVIAYFIRRGENEIFVDPVNVLYE